MLQKQEVGICNRHRRSASRYSAYSRQPHAAKRSAAYSLRRSAAAAGRRSSKTHGGRKLGWIVTACWCPKGITILSEEKRAFDEIDQRSEEQTSELKSLMRISYAVF